MPQQLHLDMTVPSVAELEKRINQCMDDKQVPWRRIEASFNDQRLWIPIKPSA